MIKAFFWAWLFAAILLDIGDLVTTYLILQNGGVELNPAAAFFFEKYGLVFGLVVWGFLKIGIIAIIGGALLYLDKDETWLKHGNLVVTFGSGMMVLLVIFLVALKSFALLMNYSALI